MKATSGNVNSGYSNLATNSSNGSNGSHFKKKVPNLTHNPKESQNPNDPLTLPPGFSSEKYQAFITTARKLVGQENVVVITDAAQLTQEHYTDPSRAHDMHNVVEKSYFVASAVLSPREVPEVQDIMRLCNEYEMPVWPFSIGRK
jgi:hypothetical protein